MENFDLIVSLVSGGGTCGIVWLMILLNIKFKYITETTNKMEERQTVLDEKLCQVVENMTTKLDAVQDSIAKRLYEDNGIPIYVHCKECDKRMEKLCEDIDKIGTKARRAESVANNAIDTLNRFQMENDL